MNEDDFEFSYGDFVDVIAGKHKGKSGMVDEVIRDVIDMDSFAAWTWVYKVRTYGNELITVAEDDLMFSEEE